MNEDKEQERKNSRGYIAIVSFTLGLAGFGLAIYIYSLFV